ncbi:MAG: glycerol-3-phosphate acyltransferase [Oscillospiraceae bacterium]|nr:glycerol-3-phosphate acyltransferase [Oscillospiraceae bacterium]
MKTLAFILAGYLSGSILFARVMGKLLKKESIAEQSRDKNPGTANAFLYGGFWCGVLTLCGDMAKGFFPVFLYMRQEGSADGIGLIFVLAAPVIGHIVPLFFSFRGGKGIATTFGCLLGLLPEYRPVAVLVLTFLFFSVVLRVTPHYYRTAWTYLLSLVLLALSGSGITVTAGFGVIVLAVMLRLGASGEEKESLKVSLLWMR